MSRFNPISPTSKLLLTKFEGESFVITQRNMIVAVVIGIEASELANVRGEREALRSAMESKSCTSAN